MQANTDDGRTLRQEIATPFLFASNYLFAIEFPYILHTTRSSYAIY